MILLITGSRTIEANESNYKLLKDAADAAHIHLANDSDSDDYPNYWTTIAHGGAKGADQLAKQLARELQLEEIEIKPNYQKYHAKAAPLMRNNELVKIADVVVAMYGPNGKTGGTADTVNKAQAEGLPMVEIRSDKTLKYTPITKQMVLAL